MASAELQSKLQHRLRKQKEAMSPAARSKGHWQPPKIVGAQVARSPEEEMLRSQIQDAMAACHEARQQKEKVEAAAVSQGIDLGADVARLRLKVEVLRRDLAIAQNEVWSLRGGACVEMRRERSLQEQASRVEALLAAAEARRLALDQEVKSNSLDIEMLEHTVKGLEDEVQHQVLGRVRLEAMLRASEAREGELRRLLEGSQATSMAMRSTQSQQSQQTQMCNTMSMALDSDDEAGDAEGCEDLEFSYEGLELSGLMSVQRALELARSRVRGRGQESGESTASSEGEREQAPRPGAEEAQYEAPLRELELALARLLGGGGAGVGPDAAPNEGAELQGYEEQLGLLQQSLDLLTASAASPPPPPEAGAPPEAAAEAALSPVVAGFSSLMWSPYAMLGRKVLFGSPQRR